MEYHDQVSVQVLNEMPGRPGAPATMHHLVALSIYPPKLPFNVFLVPLNMSCQVAAGLEVSVAKTKQPIVQQQVAIEVSRGASK